LAELTSPLDHDRIVSADASEMDSDLTDKESFLMGCLIF
jgi:hypothetical protein